MSGGEREAGRPRHADEISARIWRNRHGRNWPDAADLVLQQVGSYLGTPVVTSAWLPRLRWPWLFGCR